MAGVPQLGTALAGEADIYGAGEAREDTASTSSDPSGLSLTLIEWDERPWCDLPARLARWGVALTAANAPPASPIADGVLIICRWPTPMVLRRLQETVAATPLPVLLCTAAPSAMRGAVLEQGVADVLHPDMHAREVLARITARCRGEGGDCLDFGPLSVNRITRRVALHGRLVRLTALQFDLLVALMTGGTVSTEALWSAVWGLNFDPGTNRIAVHIHHIRRALMDAGGEVEVEAVGGGYRLISPAPIAPRTRPPAPGAN